MALLNRKERYGSLTKAFHWTIVLLFAFQYVVANIMVRVGPEETALGWSQGDYYNWHKSIGLVALGVALLRLGSRMLGELPEWSPALSERERAFEHRAEIALYIAMFLMPISGYIYVMAGGYGVRLFGVVDLANPIGKIAWLAFVAKWTHILASYALLLVIVAHVSLMLRHHLWLKNGLIHRMLPGEGKGGERPPG